jgi:hypothetical protein
MEDQRAETRERRKAEGAKIVTCKFEEGDEFKRGQFMKGLKHFGLVEPALDNDRGIRYVVVVPFSLGWEEKDGVSEIQQDTETSS